MSAERDGDKFRARVLLSALVLGEPITREIVVRNAGAGHLELTNAEFTKRQWNWTNNPAVFSFADGPNGLAAQSVPPGGYTTLTVRRNALNGLNPLGTGTYLGTVRLTSNDVGTPAYDIGLDGGVILNPLTGIVDNGDPEFTTRGNWTWVAPPGQPGFNQDHHFSNVSGSTATWTFGGLVPGRTYELAATWPTVSGANSIVLRVPAHR